jgi:hypothetical protein
VLDDPKPISLRFPTAPELGESLPGLVARAVRENVLESLLIPLHRAGISVNQVGRISLLEEPALRRLAAVVGCSEARLLALSTPYLDDGASTRFGTAVLLRKDLRLHRRHISPLTLRESPYHRSAWSIGLLPYCPESLERLRDDCSECGKKIGWKKSWGIGVCEYCENTIAPSTFEPLPAPLIDNYRLFAGLISAVPPSRSAALSQLPEELGRLDPLTLLDLCLQIGATCRPQPIKVRREAISRLEAGLIAEIAATGIGFLRDWPNSLRQWAHEQGRGHSEDPFAFRVLRDNLQALGTMRRPLQANIVRSALPDLFLSIHRSFADPGTTMIGTDVCRVTGLSTSRLRSLREAGILSFQTLPSTYRSRCQYPASEVEAIAKRFRTSVPLGSLSERLGLPIYALEQMCCSGLLERDEHPAIMLIRAEPQIVGESTASLLSAIDEVNLGTPPAGTTTLRLASRRIGGRLKPWSEIFASIVRGDLPIWIKGSGKYLDRIHVKPADMSKFDDAIFDELKEPHFPFSPLMCQRDAEEVLNVGPTQMKKAKADALTEFPISRGNAKLAERTKILQLASRVIPTSEYQQRNGLSKAAALVRLRSSGAARLSFGWDRNTAL